MAKEFVIMSHNILEGGSGRLPLVAQNAQEHIAGFLAIQEANGFSVNNYQPLKDFSLATGLPHHALAGKNTYLVASLSQVPLTDIVRLNDFRNAGIVASVDSPIGELRIGNIHLTPGTEEERLQELAIIMNAKPDLIIGDLNSLSPEDDCSPDIIEVFNAQQHKKFVKDGVLQTRVVGILLDAGFADLATQSGNNNVSTVPTKLNQDAAHAGALRLDYMFASASLASRVVAFEVVKTDLTDAASDHYPIVATFK